MIRKRTVLRPLCIMAMLAGRLAVQAQVEMSAPDSTSIDRVEIHERIFSMVDAVKQVYITIQMMPPSGKEGRVKAAVAQVMADRLKTADRAMKTIDFKWNTYYQTIQEDIADDENLINDADLFQQISQAVKDSLTQQIAKVALLQAFCQTETFMPTQERPYQELYDKAMKLSLVSKLAPELEKLKGEEKLRFAEAQQKYIQAKEAVAAMPDLQKRMDNINQQYIVLKANSEKIQAAVYKPFIQRAKDYLLGLAAVAIMLMFVNMLTGKIQALKAQRENLKKMKEMMNNANGNNYIPTIALLPFFLFLMTGCDESPQMLSMLKEGNTDSVRSLVLTMPEFADQYKIMTLEGRLGSDVSSLPLYDSSQVRIQVKESLHHRINRAYPYSPKLVKVEHVASGQIKQLGIVMLALVDLTLSQPQIDLERQAVMEIKNLFSENNLYVAFIRGTDVSETIPATDYVIQNYFTRCDSTTKYLYRSMLLKMDEMSSGSSWTRGGSYVAMIVMSDGATYQDNVPMDPQHFEMEHALTTSSLKRPLYYVNFGSGEDDYDFEDFDNLGELGFSSLMSESDNHDDTTILQALCRATRGLYQTRFEWRAVRENIERAFNVNFVDYRFTLENPDHKVYRGQNGCDLQIAFYNVNTDSLLVEGNCHYSLGSAYSPVIVNPLPVRTILMRGILHTLMLMLMVYVILQILVPYIQYRLFLRRHVTSYSDTKISDDGTLISESCYLCKAPFEVGEKVVTKCQHTMHLDCWEENRYQCPEYGRHCQNGRHYYNRYQLFDPENATFYLRWVLVGILAGLTAWIVYTGQLHPMFSSLTERIILFANNLDYDSPEASTVIEEYGSLINHFPPFGLCIGFFLALMLSCLSVPRCDWLSRLVEILIRALLGGLGGLLFFSLGGLLSVMVGITDYGFLIDWIPWALTGYWIALCVTWRTRIVLHHYLIIGAILVGVISTYLWAWLYVGTYADYRLALLVSFIVYTVALAVSIAKSAPRSERYFLTVGGIAKQMDVALYKWFKAAPNEHVTIGHSVDCHLQLSWDIQSIIAPVQAEIVLTHGVPRLFALEEGVFAGDKSLAVGKGYRLYHGRTFSIGKTTFTYIEKDN